MDLEHVIDILDSVPAVLRDYYTLKDGKYHLNVKESPRLAEFRTNNNVMKAELETLRPIKVQFDTQATELAELRPLKEKFAGLDVDAARAALAENASLKASTAAAQAAASRTKLRAILVAKALAVGAIPDAAEIVADKLEANFVIEADEVKAKPGLFSAESPGLPLPLGEALTGLTRHAHYLFKRSTGGGAGGSGSGGGTNDGKKVLRDPTPQQLGQFASEIAAGRMRVEHSE